MNKRAVGIILVCVGLVLAFVTLHKKYLENEFELRAAAATGHVVKKFTSRPDRRSNPDFWLLVVFKAEAGGSHELTQQVREEFWGRHPEGSSVTVRYLLSNPDTAEILDDAGGALNFVPMICGAAVLVLGGAGLLFSGRNRRKREMQDESLNREHRGWGRWR
jgi:hypothetical protein